VITGEAGKMIGFMVEVPANLQVKKLAATIAESGQVLNTEQLIAAQFRNLWDQFQGLMRSVKKQGIEERIAQYENSIK
jgi:hypothetical protein